MVFAHAIMSYKQFESTYSCNRGLAKVLLNFLAKISFPDNKKLFVSPLMRFYNIQYLYAVFSLNYVRAFTWKRVCEKSRYLYFSIITQCCYNYLHVPVSWLVYSQSNFLDIKYCTELLYFYLCAINYVISCTFNFLLLIDFIPFFVICER